MKSKQYLSLALVVIMTLSLLCPVSVHALDLIGSADTIDIRLNNVFEDQLAEMNRNTAELYGLTDSNMLNISLSSISTIYDFAGNEYTLVECDPVGYMIYHNSSGVFVEYSPVTNSPFFGIEGEYRYCGPNEYYVMDTDENCFRYVFDDEVLTSAHESELVNHSISVNNALVENSNEYVLNYINGTSDVRPAELYAAEDNSASTMTVTSGDWTYVNNCSFFMNLNNCGYITGGKCGYIAAGILLAYDEINNSLDTIPNSYYSYSGGQYSLSTSIATALYNKGVSLGYGASTTSVAIHYTVKSWLEGRGISADHTSLYIPFGSASTIVSKLKNDRPVIWFGAVTEQDFDSTTGNHAVVVYGYSSDWTGHSFVAHFGWTNATTVYFSGVLGSLYTYEY